MDITRDFIENTIVNIIKNIAKTKTNIVADTNLGKLGFDSLSVIAVILDLEYALNIDISDDENDAFDDIFKQDTIHELVDYVINKLNTKKK